MLHENGLDFSEVLERDKKEAKLRPAFGSVMKRGSLLWEYGSHSKKVYLIEEGLALLGQPIPRSKELQCLGVFGPGDVIGLGPFLEARPHRSTAKVASNRFRYSEIRMPLDSNAFLESFEYHQWVQKQLLKTNRAYIDQIELLSYKIIEERLKSLLGALANRFYQKKRSVGAIILPFGLTKTAIAHILNARVETVIRLLNSWEKAHKIYFKPDEVDIKSKL